MPTINLVSEDVSLQDADFTSANASGDDFRNDGRTCLWIKNEGVAGRTVTVVASGHCNHGFLHNEVLTIAAGAIYKTRTFPQPRFGSRPSVTYDAVTSLKLVAVQQGAYTG